MASKWYVKRGGNKVGPFTSPQLRKLAVLGQLQPGDLVRKQGKAKWVTAGTIKRLFSAPGESAFGQPAPSQPVPSTSGSPPLATPMPAPVLAAAPGQADGQPGPEKIRRLRKTALVIAAVLLAAGVVSGIVLAKVVW